MKITEMSYDQIKACVLKCPLTLPKADGSVPVSSGNFFAYPANNEVMKKYKRLAKKDLFERQIRGGSYDGDLGHVVIGGKKFSYYPKSSAIIRDDFAMWVDANWHKALNADGSERESTKPLRQDDVEVVPIHRHSLTAKARCQDLSEPTDLIDADAWNTLYDMKHRLQKYITEMTYDEHNGRHYIVTKIQADLLAAMIAHKERNYARAIDEFLWVAAAALKAADYESRMHAKTFPENKGTSK